MESPRNRVSFIITFDCKHTRIFPAPSPKIGDLLWCPKCAKDVHVANAPAEWRLRCQGCGYSKPFGDARLNAEISIAKHRMKFPTHMVTLYNGHNKIKNYGESYQDVIPMMPERDSEIPF